MPSRAQPQSTQIACSVPRENLDRHGDMARPKSVDHTTGAVVRFLSDATVPAEDHLMRDISRHEPVFCRTVRLQMAARPLL